MALHIKSTTKFKVLIGFSALAISAVAALFSVTGVSSLFSGAFWAVVAMMGILEFGKIVVASYLARFWFDLSKTIKAYFITAVIILMLITSAGIFGYLSDAYQKTKGDYTIVEGQVKMLETRRNFFQSRKERLERDKQLEVRSKESNQVRADSLTSRGQSITRTRQDIKDSETRISTLENLISANEDSIGYYDEKIIEAQSINIKGELGPLKFIADAFNTDMDQVVKYLMLMLIFVFDPLAVLLFVSLSTMIRKDAEKEKTEEPHSETKQSDSGGDPYDGIKKIISEKQQLEIETIEDEEEEKAEVVQPKTTEAIKDSLKPIEKKKVEVSPQEPNQEPIKEIEKSEIVAEPEKKTSVIPPVEEPIEKKVEAPVEQHIEKPAEQQPEKSVEQPIEKSPEKTIEKPAEAKDEHKFYYGEDNKEPQQNVEQDKKSITWQSANSRYRFPDIKQYW